MIKKILNTGTFLGLCLICTLGAVQCETSHSRNVDPYGVPSYYVINPSAVGYIEKVDNILNMTVVVKDMNDYRAEYLAGFIQGKLQKPAMVAARDNNWDSSYLNTVGHPFPKQIPPTASELATAEMVLKSNYNYTLTYAKTSPDAAVAKNLKRLIFRLLGIYHGTVLGAPANLDFSGNWLPDLTYFFPSELALTYEAKNLTFIDVYWLNGYPDAMDAISALGPELGLLLGREKCSAFVKKVGGEIYITHNSWSSFLDQSMVQTYFINGDFMTFNAFGPGVIGSLTDFGYNNKGMMFNETTHRTGYSEPKINAMWMLWRATLAEQFSASLDDFYKYLSLEPSGTYMNGYAIADAKTNEIGLVEMSYKNFVYFKPDGGGGYTIITKPGGASTDYDHELVTADYILGINFPASTQIKNDLQSTDNRPSRRVQFNALIGGVTDIETSKALVTYTDNANPLSIYGRWDLGYGNCPPAYCKTVPDGSVDAKAASSSMALAAMGFIGELDMKSPNKAFWMKYGTPYINGLPFIWSQSLWPDTKLREVPNVIDGQFRLLDLYIK